MTKLVYIFTIQWIGFTMRNWLYAMQQKYQYQAYVTFTYGMHTVLCILVTNTRRGGLRHDITRVQAQTTAGQEIHGSTNRQPLFRYLLLSRHNEAM